MHHNAFNWKWFCFTEKNPKVTGTDVFYLASLLSSSLTSHHILVPVNVTDPSGQSIFSYATEEKQVKCSIVNFLQWITKILFLPVIKIITYYILSYIWILLNLLSLFIFKFICNEATKYEPYMWPQKSILVYWDHVSIKCWLIPSIATLSTSQLTLDWYLMNIP